MLHDILLMVDGGGHVPVEHDEIVFPLRVLEVRAEDGIVLVHVVDDGEFQLVVRRPLRRDLRGMLAEVEAVPLAVHDAPAVVLVQDALHHDAVSVGRSGLEAGDRHLVDPADGTPPEAAQVIVFRPFAVVEMRPVVRGYLDPGEGVDVGSPDDRETGFGDMLQVGIAYLPDVLDLEGPRRCFLRRGRQSEAGEEGGEEEQDPGRFLHSARFCGFRFAKVVIKYVFL